MEDLKYYPKVIDEAREVLSSSELQVFVENVIADVKNRVSHKVSVIERELKVRSGTINKLADKLTKKEIPKKEREKAEYVFHKLIAEFEVDFYDELKKTLLYFQENPGFKKYRVFFLDDNGLCTDEIIFSILESDVTVYGPKGAEVKYEFKSHKSFNITTPDGEIRQISLDRKLGDDLEEFICGREELIGIDLSLIRTKRLVFIDSEVSLERSDQEKICLYLSNRELQDFIFPEDIYLVSVFIENVNRFVTLNKWFRITMPKFLMDSFVQFLYYFKSYVSATKKVALEVGFDNHESFFILKVRAEEKISDHVITEWLIEYLEQVNSSKSDQENSRAFSSVRSKDKDIEIQKLNLQINTLKMVVELLKEQNNIEIDLQEQISNMISEFSSTDSSITLQIVYGGNNQFAEKIINYPPLLE